MAPSAFSAGVTIGPEALLPLPTSAYYHGVVGRQPADASVQTFNPPIFSWVYFEDPNMCRSENFGGSKEYRAYQLQLSADPSFSNPIWNISCSNNFYNFLAPITNADGSTYTGTLYWRVVYKDRNLNVVSNSQPWSFTLSPTASIWDRSMLADPNYLVDAGQHPHIFFNKANRAAAGNFVRKNTWITPGEYYSSQLQTATNYFSTSWWNTSALTNQNNWPQYASMFTQIGFFHQLEPNPAISNMIVAANPGQMFEIWATNWVRYGYDRQDPYQGAPTANHLGMAYDWLYDIMTPSQRANVLKAMELVAQAWVYEQWYYFGTAPNTNRVYTNTLYVRFGSGAREGESHSRNGQAALAVTLSGMADSQILRDMQTYYLNYYIVQFDPFQGDDGRNYNAAQNFLLQRQFASFLMAASALPEAKLTNAPIYASLGSQFAFMEPVGYRNPQGEQWGVVNCPDCTFVSQWVYTRFYDLACLLNSGPIMRQFKRVAGKFGSVTHEGMPVVEGIIPFAFPAPAESDWPSNYWVNTTRGWAISMSAPPSDWGAFTNNVGFILGARPSAAGRFNATVSDGQIQMWAYGAHVTTGGSGNYEEHSLFTSQLFVDGIGLNNDNPAVANPWYSRLMAFTNTPDYTYVSADLTKAFNYTNWSSGGYQNIQTKFYGQATNARPYIANINRSVLFPHKKYLVVYDQFQTTKPAQFQWKWNIWQPNPTVNTNACSLVYNATNVYNGSNVTVYVSHVVDPSLMTLTNMTTGKQLTGIDMNNIGKINPFTGENYNGSNDPYGAADYQHYWANAVWVYNKTATTNWHFMTVVYPAKWGSVPPTITRIDDNTVRVQQGPNDDTITVDPTTNPPTFTVNLTGPALSPTKLSPPSNLRTTTP